MRTLETQLRLRRLLRAHADYTSRLDADPGNRELALAAADRLRQLSQDVRAAWAKESGGTGPEPFRRHVSRALAAMDAAAAGLGRPNTDRAWLAAQFRDAGAPLLFFLRGLEDAPEDLVAAWMASPVLQRSA